MVPVEGEILDGWKRGKRKSSPENLGKEGELVSLS